MGCRKLGKRKGISFLLEKKREKEREIYHTSRRLT